MAKAGDKPKNWVQREESTSNVKAWEDPNPDKYGFVKTMSKLEKEGFDSFKEDGVLIVKASQDKYEEIKKIITSCKFLGSWGVRSYREKHKIEIIKEEED